SNAPDLNFDFPFTNTLQPGAVDNQKFSITNLFYWSNIMHDISYLYGFDEVSGNFQENNLGRGGAGNDYLLADAQDGSGFNNANFTSPADGTKPRMQVFLFGGTPQIDADLDNGIICHEYAHGISRRLTGGPSSPGCLNNQEQMGEGWSDYFALMITTNWATAQTTDGSKKRPLGNYANSQALTGPGWRKYPYSTDMSIDPETYADLPGTGGEAHNIGEIWAAALWEMTWEIIQQDGINPNLCDVNGVGGNSIALKLVTYGMKLQPCKPGFLDGRDAILKADTLLYGGRYSCAIWKAFAKRGMGLNAKQGSSDSYTDQVVDFSTYSFPYIVNHVDKIIASEGDVVTYTISVEAPHCQDISGYSVVDTLPANLTYINSNGIYNPLNKTVTITGIDLSQGQSKNFTISGLVKSGSYSPPVNFIQDSVIGTSVSSAWETTSTTNTLWKSSAVESNSSPNAYFIKDSSGLTDATLQTSVSHTLTGKTTLSFWHYYDIEQGYDGGVLDISLDGGTTWQDLGPYIIQNGYNGSLIVNTPLIGGRQAFTGSSSGAFILTKIDLSAFTGKTVLIRFLFVSDDSGGAEGWYIDDINLVSEASIFNSAQLFDFNNQLVLTGDTITTINNLALPITLLSFTGEVQEKQNLLLWTTSSEYNNRGFEIQRSINGIDFNKIDFITTKAINGNSNLNITYNVTDLNFPPGISYYRLKQIDKDGRFSYSNIVVLKRNDFLTSSITAVYPNPAKNILNVKIASQSNKKVTLVVTDLLGNTVLKELKLVSSGEKSIQLKIDQLPANTYFLKIICSDGCESAVKKFIKE
ncbi:MAG: M36 family metallopeptidase, partial [Ginsengibacter sp.]